MKAFVSTVALLTICGVMPAFALGANEDIETMCEDRFDAIDTNNDEKLSMDEYIQSAKSTFIESDTNHDSLVSKDEHMIMMKKETIIKNMTTVHSKK